MSPSFNGLHCTCWKQKMKDFIKATNIDIREIVEHGYDPSKTLINGIALNGPFLFGSKRKRKNIS